MAAAGADEGLKRLGGGRWQTRDERFTIEPQSGTWAVVDAEQTDDLGLPLVRGPYKSLAAAKAAIAEARERPATVSPVTDRRPSRPSTAKEEPGRTAKAAKKERTAPPEPEEPRWMRDLEPADRRRATRLIERLTEAGASDAEGMVRRDLVGDVPTVAAFAVARAIRDLGTEPSPAAVAETLGDGRDPDLGVRWRLVDGDGREIRLDPDDLEG